MKKIISVLIVAGFFFSLVSVPARAAGEGNVDGSGGGMGTGSSTCYWNGGDDGVRVTVITADGTPVSTPIDYTNMNASTIQVHFGKVSKLSYFAGTALMPSVEKYLAKKPEKMMPRIISTSLYKASIASIKAYWCQKETAEMISNDTGIDYDELVSGDYKLFIEPIAYFHFKGVMYAMTATEAALFNKQLNGALRASMVSLTSKNLPLSMYLKVADIGFPAYSGTNYAQTDDVIISSLGMGIVSFKNEVTEQEDPSANYEYRCDTDVITSIMLTNNGSDDITPDSGCKVSFEILGSTYSKDFICPSGGQQLVWVKWHTPKKPQLVRIGVSAVGFDLSTSISANIVELVENTPPDPKYGDTNKSFKLEKTPDYGSNTTATWSQWFAVWIPPVPPFIPGYWEFYQNTYSAKLKVELELCPDNRVKTAVERGGVWEMKSGYGVNVNCETAVYTSGSPSFSSDYTQVQTEVATFSDFGFATYNRLLEPEKKNKLSTTWRFKENINSYYDCRVHFTPLWYPDGTDYVVALSVYDAWTPAGMLYTTASGKVHIDGNVYDDWYIRLMK